MDRGSRTFETSPSIRMMPTLREICVARRAAVAIVDQTEDQKVYGPSTSSIARFSQRNDYSAFWTIGFQGTCRAAMYYSRDSWAPKCATGRFALPSQS